MFAAIRRASSLLSCGRRTSEAISTIRKSRKPRRHDGSSLQRLIGDFVCEDHLLGLVVAVAHRFRKIALRRLHRGNLFVEASEAPPKAYVLQLCLQLPYPALRLNFAQHKVTSVCAFLPVTRITV